MNRKRHTEEQIIAVFKEGPAGIEVHKLCLERGTCTPFFISGGPCMRALRSLM